jgi:hypothetical protein
VPRRFGYDPRSHRGDHFPRRHGFPDGRPHSHLESRNLDGPRFLRRSSRPARLNGEVQRCDRTPSGRVSLTRISLSDS